MFRIRVDSCEPGDIDKNGYPNWRLNIYEQTVEDLSLQAVIQAVNRRPRRRKTAEAADTRPVKHKQSRSAKQLEIPPGHIDKDGNITPTEIGSVMNDAQDGPYISPRMKSHV